MSLPGLDAALMLAAGPSGPAVVTYVTNRVSTANQTIYTFSASNIGAEDASRVVVVGVFGNGNFTARTISGVTLGGVSMMPIVDAGNVAVPLGLFALAVPAGTAADVVVTFSGGVVDAGIGIWSLTNLQSATPTDTDADTTASSPATVSIDVQADGVVIALTGEDTSGSFTWSGITERYDAVVETTIARHSGASDAYASAATLALSVTEADGDTIRMVAAAWR